MKQSKLVFRVTLTIVAAAAAAFGIVGSGPAAAADARDAMFDSCVVDLMVEGYKQEDAAHRCCLAFGGLTAYMNDETGMAECDWGTDAAAAPEASPSPTPSIQYGSGDVGALEPVSSPTPSPDATWSGNDVTATYSR